MEGKNSEKKTNEVRKEKSKNTRKLSGRMLQNILYILIIILISLVAFVGVYYKDKNKLVNKMPEYILGTDLDGFRNVVIKVDDSTKQADEKEESSEEVIEENAGEENSDDANVDETTETKEVPVNDESVLNVDNYKKCRDIVLKRLDYMKVKYYEVKFDESDGTIYLEIPENEDTDYISQYCITKGEFKIMDSETEEVLLSNVDIKDTKTQYYSDLSGTTVYLSIEFDKEGKEKLKEISNTYVKATDEEGNETEKQIKMTLDDSEIMTTSFDEEITDGIIQLRMGVATSSSEVQTYIDQAKNAAVLLNTDVMPITYKMDINRFVYSDITTDTLKILLIAFGVIAVLMIAYMVVKYKGKGVLAAFANIGFLSILLILIRYANVELTLTGIASIFITFVAEYVILMSALRVYSKKLDNETKNLEMKKMILTSLEILVPITIMAITFAVVRWEPVFSVGMVLFWSVLIMLIYNIINIKFICRKEGK